MATEIYPGVFVPDTKKTDQYLKSRAYNYLSLYSDVRMQNWNTALTAAQKGYSEQMDAYRASLKANQEAEDRASRELKAVRDQIASVSRDYLRVDEKEAQLNEQGRQSAAQFNAGQTNAILKAKYYAEVGAAGREYSAKTAPVNTAYAPPSPPANVKADFDLWAGNQASDPKERGAKVATNFNSMAQNLDAAGKKALAEAMYARGSIYPEGSAEKNQFDQQLMDATGDAGNVDWDAIGAGIKKAKGTRDLAIEQGVQLPAAPGAQGVKPPNYSFKDSQDRRLSYLYELGGWDAVRLYVPEGIKEEDFVRDMRLAQGEGRIGDIEDERAAIKNPMAPSADVIGTARQIYSDRYEYNPGLTRIQDRTSMLGDLYQRKLAEIAPDIEASRLQTLGNNPTEDQTKEARAAALLEAQAAARQYVTDWATGGYRGAGEAPVPVGQTARPPIERTVAMPPARSEREMYGDTPNLMGLLGERLRRESVPQNQAIRTTQPDQGFRPGSLPTQADVRASQNPDMPNAVPVIPVSSVAPVSPGAVSGMQAPTDSGVLRDVLVGGAQAVASPDFIMPPGVAAAARGTAPSAPPLKDRGVAPNVPIPSNASTPRIPSPAPSPARLPAGAFSGPAIDSLAPVGVGTVGTAPVVAGTGMTGNQKPGTSVVPMKEAVRIATDEPFTLTDSKNPGRVYQYNPEADTFTLIKIDNKPTDQSSVIVFEKGTEGYDALMQNGQAILPAKEAPSPGAPKAPGGSVRRPSVPAPEAKPSEEQKLADLLLAGQELASKPQKLRRLLANTQHGKLVQQLLDSNKEARNTATFLELRDQIYRAYKGKPEQVEKAIELLAASFILAAKPASQQ